MMMRLLLFTSLVTAALSLSACGDKSGGGNLGAPPSVGGDFNAHGTITSGGGNTIDGKMAERYSEDIESLPEYAHYIIPQMRKLSQIHADVFVAYLHWAAKSKTWYFVPVHLPALPKERIALAFQSDQIALHSEKEIFIDKQAYMAESERERAFLLMHEMVMGAKLLMKKTPEKQCELLNGILDPLVCGDPSVVKTAIQNPDTKDAKDPEALLNGRDHESVRAMTIFLMDAKSNLQGANVSSRRLALDFNFPWDRALSRLDDDQIRSALQRTTLAQDTFSTTPSFASESNDKCFLTENGTYNTWQLTLGLGQVLGNETTKFRIEYRKYISNPLGLDARGVLDPSGSGEMVDLIEIEPYSQLSPYLIQKAPGTSGASGAFQIKLELYISRGAKPHVVEFRAVPVAVRTKTTYQRGLPVYQNESIEIHSMKPLDCRLDKAE